MLKNVKNIAWAILKKYCPPHKARGIHDFILATKSSVWIIIRNIAKAILKKYCPPCHEARGIHDFILATKSPVWIMMHNIRHYLCNRCHHSCLSVSVIQGISQVDRVLLNNYRLSGLDGGLKMKSAFKFEIDFRYIDSFFPYRHTVVVGI